MSLYFIVLMIYISFFFISLYRSTWQQHVLFRDIGNIIILWHLRRDWDEYFDQTI